MSHLPELPKPIATLNGVGVFTEHQMQGYANAALYEANVLHADASAVEGFLTEVRAELLRARAKFPGDRIMTIALAEEFGELCKAVLNEPAANVRKEAIQTAVMCARVVLDGDGSVNEWRAQKGLDPLTQPSACLACKGRGWFINRDLENEWRQDCHACNGSGKTTSA